MTMLLGLTFLLASANDPPRSDLEKLQGTWLLVAMEREGEDLPAKDFKDWKSVYEENRLNPAGRRQSSPRGHRHPGAFTQDQGDQHLGSRRALRRPDRPRHLRTGGRHAQAMFARPGEERPKEFTTKSGTGFLYCVYKRQKR